jgi:short-subunit dehydrogenase
MAQYPLEGRTLFITGGASGIGAETARQAAKRGARLALVDLDAEGAERVAASLPAAIAIEADVRDYDSLQAAAAKTVDAYGGIDVVMANAGIEVDGTALGVPIEKIEAIADVNFTGVLRTVKATLPYVIDRRGYVLITASLAAIIHEPPLGHYAATKAGVEAFGNAMRMELAHKGVDVGVAYFGLLDTPLVRRANADLIVSEYEAKHANNFLGKTLPVEPAVAKVIRGIEERRRRVMYPGWIRAFMVARAVVPRLMDRAIARRDIDWFVDRLEERDLEGQTEPKERLLS